MSLPGEDTLVYGTVLGCSGARNIVGYANF